MPNNPIQYLSMVTKEVAKSFQVPFVIKIAFLSMNIIQLLQNAPIYLVIYTKFFY